MSAPASSSQAAPSSGSSTKAAPAEPSSIRLPSNDYVGFGHFFVNATALKHMNDLVGAGALSLFHPRFGEIDVDAEKLLPDSNVTSQLWASAGTKDNPQIVGAVEVTEPAHDLEPQSGVVYLVRVDPQSGRLVQKTEVQRFAKPAGSSTAVAVWAIAGASDGTVAYSYQVPTVGGAPMDTMGYNMAGQKEVWHRPGRIASDTVVGDGVLVFVNATDPQHCASGAAVSIPTGAEAFMEDGQILRPSPDSPCPDIRAKPFPAAGVAAVLVNTYHEGESKSVVTAYDFVHKTPTMLDKNTTLVDEHSNLALDDQNDGTNLGALDVRDRTSGQVVYSIDAAKVQGVNLNVKSFLDQKLWVETTDEKLVMDAKNGATLERGWTTYPMAVVDNWVQYSDGEAKRTP